MRPSRIDLLGKMRAGYATGAVAVLVASVLGGAPRALAQSSECLVEFQQTNGPVTNGGSVCQTASGKKCTFQLGLCVNQPLAGCTPTDLKHKTIRAKGFCSGLPVGKVHVKANGTGSVCGALAGVKVKTKKHGMAAGTCTIKAKAGTNLDRITLRCQPESSPCVAPCGNGVVGPGEQCDPPGSTAGCPANQACNDQCQCAQVSCEPIVAGQPIANTYSLLSISGPKLCTARASANRFQSCTTDADCGGTTGGCAQTPWVTADDLITLPFPLGISTTFTIAQADSPPRCEHTACISCGNPDAACAGIPGCTDPNSGCSTTTCCDQPGFTVPTFLLPGLNFCVRVDQKACGVGVVNTSNPQNGDNDVIKMGDTSDPGADCCYNGHPASECLNGVNLNDDPAPKACGTLAGQAGADMKGKVVRTIGDGTPDPSGVHFRFSVRELATVWSDVQGCPSPPCSGGQCSGGTGAACSTDADCNATFDVGESLVSQLILNAEQTTATATAGFIDMNGDGCAVAGFGFLSSNKPGPITIGPPAVAPAPYGGGNSIVAAAGVVFPGSAPTFDLGFATVTPNGPATVVTPTQTCACTPVAGCPE